MLGPPVTAVSVQAAGMIQPPAVPQAQIDHPPEVKPGHPQVQPLVLLRHRGSGAAAAVLGPISQAMSARPWAGAAGRRRGVPPALPSHGGPAARSLLLVQAHRAPLGPAVHARAAGSPGRPRRTRPTGHGDAPGHAVRAPHRSRLPRHGEVIDREPAFDRSTQRSRLDDRGMPGSGQSRPGLARCRRRSHPAPPARSPRQPAVPARSLPRGSPRRWPSCSLPAGEQPVPGSITTCAL